ncbi:transcriptional coactivator/pterin dehydratase [Annulohypoxylon maeteangense]|uniref:transcriptional coactivator/pterin dehydratase n=1 Tax=Annulohypoxylon maeteangense TaxID=1927788 RepID=UPI00200804E3|nr:transcriptional coactivator/pterin dehydratase [Annulohypoxylon maeteangense]KAI0890448.1 transcriptional coactivator/pterin dehydratase [Annulohypoxylon maeteangense]
MPNRYARPLLRCARAAASSKIYGTARICVQGVSYQSLRNFSGSAVMAISPQSNAPRFSAGVDEPALMRTLDPLLASASRGGRWSLIPGGEGIERSFRFKTFAKTWDFMTAVSLQCKLKNHHPEWSNVYNTTYIRWTTHNPKGLSTKDVELAAICDGLAKDFGEIIEEASGGDDNAVLKQVADRAVTDAGACCTPKK